MKTSQNYRRSFLALGLSLGAGLAPLHAQTTPPPPAAASETVELSPFMVNAEKDTSWTATTTLVGSRTNQELAKVPVTVDVITAEFMNDLGLFGLEDAAAYVSGLNVTPRFEARTDETRVTYRGLGNSGTTSRNFFLWYVPSDSYNVERYDFNKGSNSLMFGDAAPGGQTTIYTKRPQSRNFAEAFASTASFGSHRYQLDVNRAIAKNFALRLNLVDRSNKTYVHGNAEDLRAVDLALIYRPFKATSVRVELERGESTRQRADNALAILDVAAAGRAFSSNNVWYVTSNGEIVQRTSTSPAAIDRSDASGTSYSLLSGQTRSVLLPNGTTKTFSGFDKRLNVLGDNDYLDRTFNVVTAIVEQRIGRLSLEAGFNQQFQHQDRNDNSFGASGSPSIIRVDGSGRPYLDEQMQTNYKVFGNIAKEGRLSAAYPLAFGKWMKQFVVVTAARRRDNGYNRRYSLANDAAPGSLTNNRLMFRAYLDDPGLTKGGFWDQFLLPNLPTTPAFHAVQYEEFRNTAPFVDVRYSKTYTASLSGDYFGGRLNSLVGLSYNKLSRKIPVQSVYATDARGLYTFPGTPAENPAAYTYDPNFDLDAKSVMAGASYALFRREHLNLNLYGVYSESFNWQSGQTFYGQVLGPITGDTKEIGFKGDLYNRKLFYTFGAYQIRRQNVAYTWSPDTLSAAQLEDLMNPNDVLPASPSYTRVVNGIGGERNKVNSAEESRGFDLTLQGQRVFGLQTRVTFSTTRVRATRDFDTFKQILNAAIVRTAAATAPGGNPALAENATNIANAQTILGSNTLTAMISGRRSAPYAVSFVFDYEVPHIRHLRLGLNGVCTPNYNVAIFSGVAFRGGASLPLSAYVLYDRKVLKRNLTFRLNLQSFYDPITGNNAYRKTGSNGFNNTTNQPNYIYRYTDPVVVSFSVTAKL